jgi:hypothetical protein
MAQHHDAGPCSLVSPIFFVFLSTVLDFFSLSGSIPSGLSHVIDQLVISSLVGP